MSLTVLKGNVGLIKWPYRLTEDAGELHQYTNPEISNALFHARQSVIEIITGQLVHPILPDFDLWMAGSEALKQEKHANDFAEKFFNARILPGDAFLIDPHTEHVSQVICSGMSPANDAFDGISMDMRRRVTLLAPLLFQLVILRIYLRRSSVDDEQIYFLTRTFSKAELGENQS